MDSESKILLQDIMVQLVLQSFVILNQKVLRISSQWIDQLDLTKLHDVQMFAVEQPEYVFLAAARLVVLVQMQSILQTSYTNLMIQTNVISSAAKHESKNYYSWDHLAFIQSLRINLSQKISYLEVILNQVIPYAVTKIAGINMCQSYRNNTVSM